MAEVKWTAKSEKDLDSLRDYLAKNFNIELAIDLVNELVQTTETMLKNNPLSGSLVETNPLFSRIIYKGNAIYYCENPTDKNLYIVYIQLRKTQHHKARLGVDSLS